MERSTASHTARATACSLLVLLGLSSCDPGPGPTPAEPTAEPATHGHGYDPSWEATQNRKRPRLKNVPAPAEPVPRVTAKPTPPIRPSPDDPLGGRWTMADALTDLSPAGRLMATIETSMGDLTCELWPDRAPLTVASFVGLARGLRPWKNAEGRWVREPAYDGTTFHQVIRHFAIQGGSPTGHADWQPGFSLPDEIWDGANHDHAGLLGMATPRPHSGGMQFFVTDGATPQLDGSYPIFGRCGPLALIHAIASVEARRGRPATPVRIERIRISRRSGAGPGATTAAPRASSQAPPSGSLP